MANFFLDNDDIQFLFNHIDLAELARIQEDDFAQTANGRRDYAPADAADAVDNYRRILEIVGEVAGDMIAPQRRAGRPRGQHAQRRRHGHAASAGAARTSSG